MMDLNVYLKYMNLKIVRVVHYVPSVQKQKKEIIENYLLMKDGKNKKNM